MENPDFDIIDLYRLFELSSKIEVSLENPEKTFHEKFGECTYCMKTGAGFSFALMGETKCIEFYAISEFEAHVFIFKIADSQPQSLGVMKAESMVIESGVLVCILDCQGYKLKITMARHMLKANPENHEKYMNEKGDALGLKWLHARTLIDRLKFEMARRTVSVGRIESDKIVEMCKRANLHSLKIGGPDEFFVEIDGVLSDEGTKIQVNYCDENQNAPNGSSYQKLLYTISFASDKDINVLRGCEIVRQEAEDFITYFFNKDEDSMAIIIHRTKEQDDSEPYEMFSAIEFHS
ncbi:hypothetical protein AO073_01785 [Pseudomonas syringae ICMP 11293]|uniref:hypothetical protein n=1 Tax=Pseudomonas syringae TaxID=317 RepID=UPI00073137D9|nr:hypothetical protein [Pseudomonas syringae]KTB91630.1 hypothetical protein AO073_01785 [Pseudomonas syringae ICMP 11293]